MISATASGRLRAVRMAVATSEDTQRLVTIKLDPDGSDDFRDVIGRPGWLTVDILGRRRTVYGIVIERRRPEGGDLTIKAVLDSEAIADAFQTFVFDMMEATSLRFVVGER